MVLYGQNREISRIFIFLHGEEPKKKKLVVLKIDLI